MEIFAQVAEKAESAGVTYCLEPLSEDQTNYVNWVEDAVEIVKEINSPGFKTMIDTCSAGLSENTSVADLIRTWMPTGHIAHIQFNDRNRRAAGQGDDLFKPIIEALNETGYEGVIAMEPFIYEPDRSSCASYTFGYIKGLMEALA